MPPTGRPRALDDTKRSEICALISAGCGVREAARYVRCAPSTIQRETRRNPEFQERLRRATLYSQLTPLRAMQQAVNTHWRAAAWFLERTHPDRFARHDPKAVTAAQARALRKELLQILGNEIADPSRRERAEKRLETALEFALGSEWKSKRSRRQIRRAMEVLAKQDRANDPFEQLGFPNADLNQLLNRRPFNGYQPDENAFDDNSADTESTDTNLGDTNSLSNGSPSAKRHE